MTHYRTLNPDDTFGTACGYNPAMVEWDLAAMGWLDESWKPDPITNNFDEVTCRECARAEILERAGKK